MQENISEDSLRYLKNKSFCLRVDSIRATTRSKSGHPTSALSAADIITALFFHVMRYDPQKPKAVNNDRFILSKGHAIPIVYAAWKHVGVISDEELMALRQFDSPLEGHPTPRFIYNEATTGSLGQGLPIGIGMALHAKLHNLSYRTYVMIGDGESSEGSIWEACEIASHYKLDNILGIIDCNRLGQSEPVLHEHDVQRYAQKFAAFGWHTKIVDGHAIADIINACKEAKTIRNQPTMLIAKTIKGYGVTNIEDQIGFHGKPFSADDETQAIEELNRRFPKESSYKGQTTFVAQLPQNNTLPQKPQHISIDLAQDPNREHFAKGKNIATRKAFGYGLAALGRASNDIIVLDGDVKNSTFTQTFEKEFPDRFLQCYIAEQNMIGMTTGLELRGNIPFAATFAAFCTRAFDQIRMAGIGRNALRISGSHAGVSIGQDGPSQMGLEDIGMMRSVPNSVVLYPSDAISTYKLTECMANYHDGISYLRTTRMDTPILYDTDESFTIGGCKILKESDNDVACVVAAGVTLHESLKASEELAREGISIAIIDLYSIKPLDCSTILRTAIKANKRIITVEDHYEAGGIGEAIASAFCNEDIHITRLCVRTLSRSGTPAELLAFAKIDYNEIIKTVQCVNR